MATGAEIKKNSKLKPFLVISLAFLMVPLTAALITYYSNEAFRYAANEYLSSMPGGLGRFFADMPTKEEREILKRQIAKHYIAFEEEKLSDKLLLIRGEDQQLFNELIPLLKRENPVKMARVSEIIRNNDIRDNLLQRIVEDMRNDRTAELNSLIDYYTGMKQSEAVRKIELHFANGDVSKEHFAELFTKLELQQAAELLYYVDPGIQQELLFSVADDRRLELTKSMDAIEVNLLSMKELAAVYANKSSSELLSEVGNDDKYSSMNLALIYRELSLKKAAEILLQVTDKEFVLGLYDSINLTEDLLEEDKNTAAELAAAVQVLQSYEANLNKLLPVYQKMPVEELAELVEQMLKSNQIYQRHTFSEEEIVFTQEQLVLDVLRRMSPARVAELLGQLSTARSAELSNKLMQN